MSSDLGASAAANPSQMPAQVSRAAAWLGLVNLLSKGSQILVTLALARFLGAAALGQVTIMATVLNLGQLLTVMGVYDVVARTARPAVEFAGTVATLGLVVSGLLATLTFIFADSVSMALNTPGAGPLIRAAALGLPFIAYGGVQLGLIHRNLDFRRRMLPDAGSAVAGAVATVLLAALGFGTRSVVVGVLITCLSMPAFGFVVGIVVPLRWHRLDARETIRWIRVVGPGAVLGLVLLNVDYLVVSHYLGAAPTGVYSLAYRFAFVPYIMGTVVLSAVAFPTYSKLVREANWAGLEQTLSHFLFLTLAVVGCLYVGLALLSDRVVILSPRWEQSGPVLAVLCGYGMCLSLQLTFQTALRALGHPGLYLVSQVIHCSLLLPSLLILVPRHGILGAAWAQLCASGLSMLTTLTILHIVTRLRWQRSLERMARGLVAAGVTLAAGLALRHLAWFQVPDSLTRSAVLGIAVLAIYVIALAIVERQQMIGLAAGLGRRRRPGGRHAA